MFHTTKEYLQSFCNKYIGVSIASEVLFSLSGRWTPVFALRWGNFGGHSAIYEFPFLLWKRWFHISFQIPHPVFILCKISFRFSFYLFFCFNLVTGDFAFSFCNNQISIFIVWQMNSLFHITAAESLSFSKLNFSMPFSLNADIGTYTRISPYHTDFIHIRLKTIFPFISLFRSKPFFCS